MISVIIPTYNEAEQIEYTISHICNPQDSPHLAEIIVADGGSSDDTIRHAEYAGAKIILSSAKGRAAQMNAGAAVATNKILYFLHADSLPPAGFAKQIVDTINNGYSSGCYRLRFDYDHWFLKANCWFTRFNINAIRFGDQSLFVTKKVLEQAGGFDEKCALLEDQEIIHRLKKYGKFKVMNAPVVTSARKYVANGVYRMQAIFYMIYFLYKIGYSQERLLRLYRKMVRQEKV